jgi:hypothetical protein
LPGCAVATRQDREKLSVEFFARSVYVTGPNAGT